MLRAKSLKPMSFSCLNCSYSNDEKLAKNNHNRDWGLPDIAPRGDESLHWPPVELVPRLSAEQILEPVLVLPAHTLFVAVEDFEA